MHKNNQHMNLILGNGVSELLNNHTIVFELVPVIVKDADRSKATEDPRFVLVGGKFYLIRVVADPMDQGELERSFYITE